LPASPLAPRNAHRLALGGVAHMEDGPGTRRPGGTGELVRSPATHADAARRPSHPTRGAQTPTRQLEVAVRVQPERLEAGEPPLLTRPASISKKSASAGGKSLSAGG